MLFHLIYFAFHIYWPAIFYIYYTLIIIYNKIKVNK